MTSVFEILKDNDGVYCLKGIQNLMSELRTTKLARNRDYEAIKKVSAYMHQLAFKAVHDLEDDKHPIDVYKNELLEVSADINRGLIDEVSDRIDYEYTTQLTNLFVSEINASNESYTHLKEKDDLSYIPRIIMMELLLWIQNIGIGLDDARRTVIIGPISSKTKLIDDEDDVRPKDRLLSQNGQRVELSPEFYTLLKEKLRKIKILQIIERHKFRIMNEDVRRSTFI